MPEAAAWPPQDERSVLGKKIPRLDGPDKVTGRAKYAFDINRPDMLYAKVLGAKHAAATVTEFDPSEAEAMEGVEAIWVQPDIDGKTIHYSGQVLAAVAAVTEEIAEEALHRIHVAYELRDPVTDDTTPEHGGNVDEDVRGSIEDVEQAFEDADVVSSGHYGCATITHCCLEPHGHVAEFRDGDLHIWASTQNVSRYGQGLTDTAELPQDRIHVICEHMGGGFGSKLGDDIWGRAAVHLAKVTGKPVKLLLDRDLEQQIAGSRPSSHADVEIALNNDGEILAWRSHDWGSGGQGGYNRPHLPYTLSNLSPAVMRTQRVATNRGSARAWRAPLHPNGCLITMAALEDAAAAIGMDALEFFLNHVVDLTNNAEAYREELPIAAEMISYQDKAHLRGDETPGPVKRGLGIALHQWGGMGHNSNADVTIHPDGSVEVACGTQDLGTGSRTVLAIVVGETLGLPVDRVHPKIGRNAYPISGASGGSTTIGGISAASRLAAVAARDALFERVAPELGVEPGELEARDGRVQEQGNPENGMSWEEACGVLGVDSLTERGECVPPQAAQAGLISAGAAGCQIADVSVDVETGVVKLNEFVCVQDCGLIVSMETARSQVFGGMIMGVSYALYEEAIYDPVNGVMLNPDLEFYRLASMAEVGDLKVHMMTGPRYDERGVIGLGEPPVIGPGAAISNAIANACGVRVGMMPMTPDRVIQALAEGGKLA